MLQIYHNLPSIFIIYQNFKDLIKILVLIKNHLVKVGDKIKKGDIIADGPATKLEN